jgi:hypothetical protein
VDIVTSINEALFKRTYGCRWYGVVESPKFVGAAPYGRDLTETHSTLLIAQRHLYYSSPGMPDQDQIFLLQPQPAAMEQQATPA